MARAWYSVLSPPPPPPPPPSWAARALSLFIHEPPPPPPPPALLLAPPSVEGLSLATWTLIILPALVILYKLCVPKRTRTTAGAPGARLGQRDESPLPLSELKEAVSKFIAHDAEHQVLDGGALLLRMQKTLEASPKASESRAARAKLAAAGLDLDQTRERYAECQQALGFLGSTEGWTHAYELGTIQTYTRRDENGQPWVKTEGIVVCSVYKG